MGVGVRDSKYVGRWCVYVLRNLKQLSPDYPTLYMKKKASFNGFFFSMVYRYVVFRSHGKVEAVKNEHPPTCKRGNTKIKVGSFGTDVLAFMSKIARLKQNKCIQVEILFCVVHIDLPTAT